MRWNTSEVKPGDGERILIYADGGVAGGLYRGGKWLDIRGEKEFKVVKYWCPKGEPDLGSIGLHPATFDCDCCHHTDFEFTPDDLEYGQLAHFLGTLFADVDGEQSDYWYHKRTSLDEWSRVARALRRHGLKIVDAK